MDAVTLRHVDKAYTSYSTEIVITGEQRQSRTRQVLKDLSVTFAAGQLTVIVGRSGCGKSTLLKLLAGKEQPDAGEISIPQGWHSAMLSPDPYVITWTNVQRNVAMACGVGKTPEERYEKAADFVRLVGLEDYADLTPMELSTGMKQRLGIAMALLGSPRLLILDEPTNGLDPAGIQEMRALIHDMPDACGATVLISSHLLGEMEQIVSQVGIINHGQLLFEGPLTELQRHSRGNVVLRLLAPDRGAAVLRRYGLTPQPADNGCLLPTMKDARLAALVQDLAAEGAGVVGVERQTKNLEEIFLSLTNTQTGKEVG